MRAQPLVTKFSLLLFLLSTKLFAQYNVPQFNPNPTSPDSIVWRDGGIAYAATLDCITGVANGVGGYVGQLIDDPGFSQPYVGQRFYMRIGAAALASPCVGSYLGVTFIPPAGMTISPDVGYGTRCFYKPVNSSQYQEFTQYCPQPPYSIIAVPGGTAYFLASADPQNAGRPAWPFAFGSGFIFQIPVVSNRTMNGLDTTSGIQAYAPMQYIDGVNSPWIYPQLSVYVAPAPVTVDPIFANRFE
jgi:hypothetical protein